MGTACVVMAWRRRETCFSPVGDPSLRAARSDSEWTWALPSRVLTGPHQKVIYLVTFSHFGSKPSSGFVCESFSAPLSSIEGEVFVYVLP